MRHGLKLQWTLPPWVEVDHTLLNAFFQKSRPCMVLPTDLYSPQSRSIQKLITFKIPIDPAIFAASEHLFIANTRNGRLFWAWWLSSAQCNAHFLDSNYSSQWALIFVVVIGVYIFMFLFVWIQGNQHITGHWAMDHVLLTQIWPLMNSARAWTQLRQSTMWSAVVLLSFQPLPYSTTVVLFPPRTVHTST